MSQSLLFLRWVAPQSCIYGYLTMLRQNCEKIVQYQALNDRAPSWRRHSLELRSIISKSCGRCCTKIPDVLIHGAFLVPFAGSGTILIALPRTNTEFLQESYSRKRIKQRLHLQGCHVAEVAAKSDGVIARGRAHHHYSPHTSQTLLNRSPNSLSTLSQLKDAAMRSQMRQNMDSKIEFTLSDAVVILKL